MRLDVVVTPKADRDAVVGWKMDAEGRRELAIRVTSVPEGGKATRVACKVLAKALGVPPSSVTCVRGQTSRHKQVEVPLSDMGELEERLGS